MTVNKLTFHLHVPIGISRPHSASGYQTMTVEIISRLSLSLKKTNLYFDFMYMDALSVSMPLYHMCVGPIVFKRMDQIPETGTTDGCELPCTC